MVAGALVPQRAVWINRRAESKRVCMGEEFQALVRGDPARWEDRPGHLPDWIKLHASRTVGVQLEKEVFHRVTVAAIVHTEPHIMVGPRRRPRCSLGKTRRHSDMAPRRKSHDTRR